MENKEKNETGSLGGMATKEKKGARKKACWKMGKGAIKLPRMGLAKGRRLRTSNQQGLKIWGRIVRIQANEEKKAHQRMDRRKEGISKRKKAVRATNESDFLLCVGSQRLGPAVARKKRGDQTRPAKGNLEKAGEKTGGGAGQEKRVGT